MNERLTVQVGAGRSVDVITCGPPDGMPFVFHTGTPCGLVPPLNSMTDAAAAAGLRMILYARPGYGTSSPQPGRRVSGAAADVAAILGHLGASTFVTAGWSGGGPHALACAALLPGRCLAAASVAGVAPRDADGLDWMAGMAQENHQEFGAAQAGREPLTEFLEQAAEQLADVTGEEVAAGLGGLVTDADRAVLTGQFASYIAESFRVAVSTGVAGWRDDDLAFVASWGFKPERISSPVSVWQGGQDAMVPSGHGQWLASRIPRARAHLLAGEGHLTLVAARFADILADLARTAERS